MSRSNQYSDYNLIVKGIVVDNNDPLNSNRVKVRIPCYHGISNSKNSISDDNLPWAQTLVPITKEAQQDYQIGRVVWIQFEGGDIRYPVIIGLLGTATTISDGTVMTATGSVYSGSSAVGSTATGSGTPVSDGYYDFPVTGSSWPIS